MDRVRVIRIIVYEGSRKWVEEMIIRSIHGTKELYGNRITAATLGEFPDILYEEKKPIA